MEFFFPSRFVGVLLVRLGLGLPLITAGLGLGGWAVRTLMKAGTDPRPHSPVSLIVIHGPFSFSRNPIYLSGIIIIGSVAVAVDTLWLLLLIPVSFLLISPQVRREEEYLEQRFGEEYRKYKRNVRRWL